MLRQFTALLITFWVGGLWVTGVIASILFDAIDDRQLAGNVAGQLFEMVSYIGIASGLLLLAQRFIAFGVQSLTQRYVWIIMSMVLLILVGYFGVQSHLAQLKKMLTRLMSCKAFMPDSLPHGTVFLGLFT